MTPSNLALSKRVDALVSHQLSRWETAGRLDQVHPTVAIANLPGAGGEEVGRLIGEALHYVVFGREIVDDIARRRGVAETLLSGLDGRMRSSIERYVTDLFQRRTFREADFFAEVARAVMALGRRGRAVIVGRGSAFLLAPESTLRVFVTAPLAARIARVADERSLTTDRAQAYVKNEDGRRIEFIHHFFGVRIDDPLAYDAVLNTGALGVGVAARSLVDLFRARFPGEPAAH